MTVVERGIHEGVSETLWNVFRVLSFLVWVTEHNFRVTETLNIFKAYIFSQNIERGGFKKVKLRENWSKTALIFCIKSVLFFLKVNHCCSCLSHNCPRCKMQLIYIVFTEIMKESFWGFSIHTILLLDEKSALIRTGLCQLCKNIKWNNKIGGEIL